LLAKETKALKKRIRQHIGFHPTLKLTRPAGTGEKLQKVPVRLNGGSVRSLERCYPYDIAVQIQKSGRGLFTELSRSLVAASGLSNPLVRRFEAWVDTGNNASCGAFEKAGFRVYGSYTAAMVDPVRLVTGRPSFEDLGDYSLEAGSASVQEQKCR
jgi:hypothetical protein